MSQDSQDNCCIICTQTWLYSDSDEHSGLGYMLCGHTFHFLCITHWLSSKPKAGCPVCRKEKTSREPVHIYFGRELGNTERVRKLEEKLAIRETEKAELEDSKKELVLKLQKYKKLNISLKDELTRAEKVAEEEELSRHETETRITELQEVAKALRKENLKVGVDNLELQKEVRSYSAVRMVLSNCKNQLCSIPDIAQMLEEIEDISVLRGACLKLLTMFETREKESVEAIQLKLAKEVSKYAVRKAEYTTTIAELEAEIDNKQREVSALQARVGAPRRRVPWSPPSSVMGEDEDDASRSPSPDAYPSSLPPAAMSDAAMRAVFAAPKIGQAVSGGFANKKRRLEEPPAPYVSFEALPSPPPNHSSVPTSKPLASSSAKHIPSTFTSSKPAKKTSSHQAQIGFFLKKP